MNFEGMTFDDKKVKAKELGVNFPHNISEGTLEKRIVEALENAGENAGGKIHMAITFRGATSDIYITVDKVEAHEKSGWKVVR